MMKSFADIERKIIRWGEDRGIVKNGKPLAQSIKTLEEVTELIDALNRDSRSDMEDAIGDVVVTLLMICAITDTDFIDCMYLAYDEIKDRKGYLREDGVFVKNV
jgi:NTP pyrophosphatase (non-canonical NTP hydrolase)